MAVVTRLIPSADINQMWSASKYFFTTPVQSGDADMNHWPEHTHARTRTWSYTHIHLSPTPHKQRHTIPVGRSKAVILVVQAWFCRVTLWFMAFRCVSVYTKDSAKLRLKHLTVTFSEFIPHQQWCRHPEKAPLCYSVRCSAYLAWYNVAYSDCLS